MEEVINQRVIMGYKGRPIGKVTVIWQMLWTEVIFEFSSHLVPRGGQIVKCFSNLIEAEILGELFGKYMRKLFGICTDFLEVDENIGDDVEFLPMEVSMKISSPISGDLATYMRGCCHDRLTKMETGFIQIHAVCSVSGLTCFSEIEALPEGFNK